MFNLLSQYYQLLSYNSKNQIQKHSKENIIMFITKLLPHFSKQTKISLFKIDPEGKKVAFLKESDNKIVIATILAILEYVLEWKKLFNLSGKYSSEKQPYYKYTIKLLSTSNPHLIQFSKEVQGNQLLAVAYLSGIVEIYNIQNQAINKRIQTNNCPLKLHFIDMDLYITLYNLTLVKYSRNSSTEIQGKTAIFDQMGQEQIYQDKNYNLCKGKQILIRSQNQKCETSYEQYLNLELQGKQWNPIVYIPTACGNYYTRRTVGGQVQIYSIGNQINIVEKLNKYPYFSPFQYGIEQYSIFAEIGDNQNVVLIKVLKGGIIAQFKDLKHGIIDIIWIGPYQLLLLQQNESVYFLEIFHSFLQSMLQNKSQKDKKAKETKRAKKFKNNSNNLENLS